MVIEFYHHKMRYKYHGYNERLELARQKIKLCVERWTKNEKRSEIVQGMQAMVAGLDRSSQISASMMAWIQGIESDDPDWAEAKAVLEQAQIEITSKDRFRVYRRDNETGEYVHIQLNFSGLPAIRQDGDANASG